LSLAYYAASRTDRMKSVMVISSGIETKNFQKAYDEIQLQLAKMQAGEIEESELAAAKKYLANGLTAMYDSVRALEDYYLSQAIMGQNQSPEELIQALDGVGIPEIQAVMQKVQLDTVYFLKGVEA
jgi:predicted Zn-dependent peptidase